MALPGVELEGARVQQAALLQMIAARLQKRVLGLAISVVRSTGVLGSASKVGSARSPRSKPSGPVQTQRVVYVCLSRSVLFLSVCLRHRPWLSSVS